MNSTELKGFLTGLILGDGYIDKGVQKRAFRQKTISKDFADYIYKFVDDNTDFKTVLNSYPSSYKDGVSRQQYYEIYIKAHPYFRKLYSNHYDDYRNRRVLSETLNNLTPQGIANWYMSDGYVVRVGIESGVVKHRRVELCMDRYSYEDVMKTKEYFENKYELKMSIVTRNKVKGQYRLRFKLETINIFFDLISQYVVPDMKYKLDLCYEVPTPYCITEGEDIVC
jgi:hypothetical protein